ncbi:hypothetical protein [Defluviimonas sp. SAOS-178_SWC]|uniref:hypothetical protein n=1 Tax=Defluviimonas sp. SAOS-178_SWC TaxID=3121287 RepID=UPI003221E2D9
MALAALMIGTVAGIASFALALLFGQSLLVAHLAWWATGTVTTVVLIAAAAVAPQRDDLGDRVATA